MEGEAFEGGGIVAVGDVEPAAGAVVDEVGDAVGVGAGGGEVDAGPDGVVGVVVGEEEAEAVDAFADEVAAPASIPTPEDARLP